MEETKFRTVFYSGTRKTDVSTIVFYRPCSHRRSWQMHVRELLVVAPHTKRQRTRSRTPATAKLISMEEISRHLAPWFAQLVRSVKDISAEGSYGIVNATNRWKFLHATEYFSRSSISSYIYVSSGISRSYTRYSSLSAFSVMISAS